MHFLKFELKNWLRAPMPWIFLAVFMLLTLPATVTDNVQIGGSYGNVWKNAPYVAQNWYAVFSILSLLLVTAFMNGTALRDFESRTAQIVFSMPVRKLDYFFGKFLGALLVCLIPMFGVSLGMWLGAALNGVFNWLPPERFGPFELASHLNAYLIFVLPNMVFAGSIVYAVAMLTRSTLYSFIASVVLLVGYIIAGNLIRDINNETLGALIDPFGFRPYELATKYWTVDEKNHNSIQFFNGFMLPNRLLWMGVGILVLLFAYVRFQFAERSRKTRQTVVADEGQAIQHLGELPKITLASGIRAQWAQFLSQWRTDFTGVLKSTPFLLLTLIGLLNVGGSMASATEGYGTHNLPVTYTMVDIVRGSFYLFLISIFTYFAGALVWKERNARVNEIYDALPTRNWTVYAGKYMSILSIIAVLQLVSILVAVASQLLLGFPHIQLDVYVRELLVIDLLSFACLTAMAMLVHVLSPNMYLGFFISIVIIIANAFVWDALHIESNMAQFPSDPSYTISDFYGYKPFAAGLFWFRAYWLLFSLLLAVAAILLWTRGTENRLANRFNRARREWVHYRGLGVGALVVWVVTAGFVFYNTQVLNTYQTSDAQDKLQVRYEKEYKKYENAPQPRIYNIKYDIQIFPENRKLLADGQYWVRNQYDKPIDTLFVQLPLLVTFSLQNERLQLLHNDSAVYFRLYRLQPALQPGDSMLLTFHSEWETKGFENQLRFQEIMPNGSFFNNTNISPNFGYQSGNELTDKNKRQKYGLPEKSRLPALNPADSLHRQNNYLTNDADLVQVETVISTAPDQLAIAPGSLVRQWTGTDGRAFFQYKLDHAGWNFYSFMSARYEVARRKWNGIDLEVYYHPSHIWNVERMLNAMQQSLEYYTANFGPYYHKQCRIIEFPRYAQFAQAFPGTMPYSEGIGFIENFQQEKDDIDMVFYIVAHEMGHQYWAHQECGAAMQGSEMTTETFAQYSALMVMEHQYGRDQMRKFLEYEMDRYLKGRSRERLKEMPLAKCENQGYIHYQKGSIVMYYLKEMIGEDKVNTALRTFLEKFRYKQAPYPVSTDAVNEFHTQTPDSLKYLIQDLFWDITLFENRTVSTELKDLGNDRYEVTLQLETRKLKADELGKETEVPVNDWIEIGALAKPEGDHKYGKILHRQRVKLSGKDHTLTFVVQGKPYQVGVDPCALLVDRNPEDNLKEVK